MEKTPPLGPALHRDRGREGRSFYPEDDVVLWFSAEKVLNDMGSRHSRCFCESWPPGGLQKTSHRATLTPLKNLLMPSQMGLRCGFSPSIRALWGRIDRGAGAASKKNSCQGKVLVVQWPAVAEGQIPQRRFNHFSSTAPKLLQGNNS